MTSRRPCPARLTPRRCRRPPRQNYPHPIIAREGWPFIAASVAAALGVQWLAGAWWALPLWGIVAFMVQFFRDPPRAVPRSGEGGARRRPTAAIVAVERARDPYLDRDALKISVFMNVFNVHSNRSPVDGEIRERWYHPASSSTPSCRQVVARERAQRAVDPDSERRRRHLRADRGAHRAPHPVLCGPGQRLARGERYGFIRFGSRVDVYLPPESRPVAAVGDKVHATESILAVLP